MTCKILHFHTPNINGVGLFIPLDRRKIPNEYSAVTETVKILISFVQYRGGGTFSK